MKGKAMIKAKKNAATPRGNVRCSPHMISYFY
jgi:hypothetical protein